MTTRRARYAAAIRALESRGERPTARAVLRECGYPPRLQDNGYGKVIDNGMGGEELRIFADAMRAAGYMRIPRGRYAWDLRWEKFR